MRLIHTSDWHLGRLFHGRRLTEDQSYILTEFVALVKEERPDAIIIAGDVYDRAVPPVEAVSLLDETLARVLLDLNTPVFMIAGNHDSPERVGFASRLLKDRGLFVAGVPQRAARPIVLEDAYGPVEFYLFPYAEPAYLRQVYEEASLTDHHAALAHAVRESLRMGSADVRKIAIAHAFVAGSSSSESERPLSVGGSYQVSAPIFAPFAYTALGHLHNPQTAGAPNLRYAGSLYKYSFDEAGQKKGVQIVTIDETGAAAVETIRLPFRRDVRVIEGEFGEILRNRGQFPASDDYISVKLTNTEPIVDVYKRLSEVYPNLMQVERPALTAGKLAQIAVDYRKIGEAELFAAFYEQMTGAPLNERQGAAFRAELDEMLRMEREAKA